MGLWDYISGLGKIETPDATEFATEAKKIKTEFRKIDVNTINVKYYFRNSPYFIDTKATLHRTTNFTIGIIEHPDTLGFILADDSIYFNKATKTDEIYVKEGYPFSLKLDVELTRELDMFKKEHQHVKEYLIPIMINQMPLSVVRVKLKHILPGFPSEMEITQKAIYQLFFTKILSKVNKEKIRGAFILVLLGFLAGGLFGFAFGIYMMK